MIKSAFKFAHLLFPGIDDHQVGILQLAVLVRLVPGQPTPRKPVAAAPVVHPVHGAAFCAWGNRSAEGNEIQLEETDILGSEPRPTLPLLWRNAS